MTLSPSSAELSIKIQNTMISQTQSQSQTQGQSVNSPVVTTTRVPSIPARRHAPGPSSLFLSPSQIAKYVYNGDLMNNDDDMVEDDQLKLKVDSTFHTTSMNQVLDYIQKQCATKYGQKMGFRLSDMMMILRVKKIYYQKDDPKKIMSMLFDLVDIIYTGKSMDDPLFSPRRSLFMMNRPFSDLSNVVSLYIYNKYYISKFRSMEPAELTSYKFVLLVNFACERMTYPDANEIKQANHYKWDSGITDSAIDNSYLRLLLNRWQARKDRIYYKNQIEYPIIYTLSIEDFLKKAFELKEKREHLTKRNPEQSLVSNITLYDKIEDNSMMRGQLEEGEGEDEDGQEPNYY